MKFKELAPGQRIMLLASLNLIKSDVATEDVKYKYVTQAEIAAMFYEVYPTGTMFKWDANEEILVSVPNTGPVICMDAEDDIDPALYHIHPAQ